MLLQVRGISKTFQNNGTGKTVLTNVCLDIEGEFVSLLGPSGCGKTTLLTIIAGFQEPSGGAVLLNGSKVTRPGPERGFVFQDYALFPWMTVRENILFPMKQQKIPKKIRHQKLAQLLDMAQLNGSENMYPSQLSGGMKQRTAVIRALASDPEVLLMDEPFGAVDYQMRHSLQEEFVNLWQKNRKPVIMVTHDVEEAVFLSDRILIMSKKQGTITSDLHVDISRPRNRMDAKYQAYVNRLTATLKAL